jgi:hydrogenase expression/formation protein HypC
MTAFWDLDSMQGCAAGLTPDRCITCGDVAVPVKVIEVRDREAVVEDRVGQRATVAVDFVPDVRAGEILLVHSGVAIGRASEVWVSDEVRR